MRRGYSIGELAKLSGASVRSLRFYEEAGLLNPERDPANGYRRYSEADVDRLQEILLLRRLDVPVRDIAPLLSTSKAGRRTVLQHHLTALKRERDRLNTLITTVEYTLAEERGETTMQDSEKFEGLKRDLVEENERRYGAEARERYGAAAVDESTRKMLNMSEHDYEAWRGLEEEIRAAIEAAVRGGADPGARRVRASASSIAAGCPIHGLPTPSRRIAALLKPTWQMRASRRTTTAMSPAAPPGCATPSSRTPASSRRPLIKWCQTPFYQDSTRIVSQHGCSGRWHHEDEKMANVPNRPARPLRRL